MPRPGRSVNNRSGPANRIAPAVVRPGGNTHAVYQVVTRRLGGGAARLDRKAQTADFTILPGATRPAFGSDPLHFKYGRTVAVQSLYPSGLRCRPSLTNSSARGMPSSPSIPLETSM